MSAITTPHELLEALKAIHSDKNIATPQEYRYIIYARKSSEDEEKQVRSLADQVLECKEFAVQHNLKIVGIIQESESAKEPDIRPKFREMLNDLKAGKYDGVLAWHPDRLARNMKDAGEIIDLVDKQIIRDLKFVSFTFENSTSGKMLLGITFVLSKEYSDKLSDNVSRGNRRSIEEGKYINKPKHGYYKDPNQYLRPDGNNFILIKNAFKMRLEGKTLDDIAMYLNDNGYYRSNSTGTKKFRKMDKQKVEKFLKDPVYTGVLMYGRNNIVNLADLYDFVPMITVEEFMSINKLTNNAQMIRLSKSYRKAENVKANLMRGMIICAECGEPMTAGITPKKAKNGITRYFYYRCSTDDCPRYGKSLRAKVIMNYIYAYLKTKPFSSNESYEHYAQEMKHISEDRVRQARSSVLSLQAQKRKLEEKLLKTKELLLDEKDEQIKGFYKNDLKKVESDLKNLDENIDRVKKIIDSDKAVILTHSEFIELMENMPKTMAQIKNMGELDYIIRKIFLNFSIQGKNVINSTLNSPFDALETQKVSLGGRGET